MNKNGGLVLKGNNFILKENLGEHSIKTGNFTLLSAENDTKYYQKEVL